MSLVVAALAPACDPTYSICVTVTSCDDADPIVGAKVQFPEFQAEEYSQPNGVACYGNVGELPESVEIVVEKPGYQLERTRVDTPGGPGNFDAALCLKPE